MTTPTVHGKRLQTIDAVRGLVMVVMALDHVRDILQSEVWRATDFYHTTPVLFFTRWITHFCAPTFVFLAGVGAALGLVKKTRAEMSWFLITRGLWLVFLELTITFYSWFPYARYTDVPMSVLWALGWSMVALAGLIWLPRGLVLVLAVVVIAGHNSTDHWNANDFGPWRWLWGVMHGLPPREGLNPFGPETTFYPAYPLAPWIALMAAGYASGPLFHRHDRRKWFVVIGVLLSFAFVTIRYTNRYGDPRPWFDQGPRVMTFCSFLDCTKYPPSLAYLLMTLGGMFLLLAVFDGRPTWFSNWLSVYGRVPMFYYLVHLPLIELFALGMLLVGWPLGWYTSHPVVELPLDRFLGLSLLGSYVIWIIVVLLLYYPCKMFGRWKRESKSAWLSYF